MRSPIATANEERDDNDRQGQAQQPRRDAISHFSPSTLLGRLELGSWIPFHRVSPDFVFEE
jgi:hypothetical protein